MKKARVATQKGFTLLEALVGMMILIFGLLAVVTMLDVSFSTGTLSKDMTTATELATYMQDRLRFESSARNDPIASDLAKLGTFTNSMGADLVLDTSAPAPASEPGRSAFLDWKQRIESSTLQNGRGKVTIDLDDAGSANNHKVSIEVSWQGLLRRQVVINSILPRS